MKLNAYYKLLSIFSEDVGLLQEITFSNLNTHRLYIDDDDSVSAWFLCR